MRHPLSRPAPLTLGAILGLAALAVTQKPISPPEPLRGSAATQGPARTRPHHDERDPAAFPLFLAPAGSDGSLIRKATVTGSFDREVARADFDSGALDGSWSTWSSTPNGRIQVSGAFGTAAGDGALLMDTTVNGPLNLNEAVWTVDLTGIPYPILWFSTRTFGDESTSLGAGAFNGHRNGDGISISNDGIRWWPVFSSGSGTWSEFYVDLAYQAQNAGMTLGAGFQIKFQQYDNSSLGSGDGRGYDEVRIGQAGTDPDVYEVTIDPGQKLSLRLTPYYSSGFQGSIRVERGNVLLAAAAAAAAGQTVTLQSIDTLGQLSGQGVGPRTYTITVTNLDGGYGYYELTAALNLELENESPAGVGNDFVATAENLGQAFVPLHNSVKANSSGKLPRRAAIAGAGGTKSYYREDFEAGALGAAWTTSSSSPFGRIQVSDQIGAGYGAFALVMDSSNSLSASGTFHETFAAPSSLDLGSNLTLQLQGSSYLVGQGLGSFQTPASPTLTTNYPAYSTTNSWDDGQTGPIALPASWGAGFPYPGGVTNAIDISSNGYVYLQPGSSPLPFYGDTTQLFNAPPRLAVSWCDWDPSAGGSLHYDVGPGDAWVAITWWNVPEWNVAGNQATFQILLYPDGRVDYVYQGAINSLNAPQLVGWADGQEGADGGAVDISAALPFVTVSSGSAAVLNEATWTVNLAGIRSPRLSFVAVNFNDEATGFAGPFTGSANADGVAISADGIHWHPLTTALDGTYYSFDLAQAAQAAGITLGASTRIRFQQYDNLSYPSDGRAFDEITIDGEDQDHYRIRLQAGEALSLYTASAGVGMEMVDATGAVVAGQQRDPIVNGSFEAGWLMGWEPSVVGNPYWGWNVTSAGSYVLGTFDPVAPQDGSYAAWNDFAMYDSGGLPGPFRYTLAQNLTLPTQLPGLLRWSDRIQWDFTQWPNVVSQPQTYQVELRDPTTDALLATLFQFATGTEATTPTGNTGWMQHSADLSPWAGSTVRLVFTESIPEAYAGLGRIEFDAIKFDGVPRNIDSWAHFTAPATGDYYLRVQTQGAYEILVLENAELGLESNDTLATAWPIGGPQVAGRRWIVGHAGAATVDPDHYRFQGTVGRTVVIETYTPGSGDGAFVNDLDPMLWLHDAAGNLLASDDNSGSDGRNPRLEYTLPASGDYVVAVGTASQTRVSESFEGGVLGANWTTSSSNANGRIRVTNAVGAGEGSYALIMDVLANATPNTTNQATMTVDLSGATGAKLRFAHASYSDEQSTLDGIFILTDGTTFTRIWAPPAQTAGVWQTYEIDLAAIAAARNLTLGANFMIRFQQSDNQTYPFDGRGWDAISVVTNKAAGEYVLSIKGDN